MANLSKEKQARAEMLAANEDAIEISEMNKWFGSFHVLRDINLNVKRGERIVVAGPSGSGKSTLIRCVNRLEEHQTGKIVVDGTELTSDLKNIWGAIQGCELLITEVDTNEEAFNLFEVLNARGKKLETGDLLKNHIFRELYDTKDFEKYADKWDDEIVSNLKNPSELVLMLRHYYFTKNGFVTKIGFFI